MSQSLPLVRKIQSVNFLVKYLLMNEQVKIMLQSESYEINI